jgi:hypothetical protein
METPTLFDTVHPSVEGSLAGAARCAGSSEDPEVDRALVQQRIRELNEDRFARQDDGQRAARRRAAVARLRRRLCNADEVDLDYWDRRRASLHLIG